jgi:hypothetical protein
MILNPTRDTHYISNIKWVKNMELHTYTQKFQLSEIKKLDSE